MNLLRNCFLTLFIAFSASANGFDGGDNAAQDMLPVAPVVGVEAPSYEEDSYPLHRAVIDNAPVETISRLAKSYKDTGHPLSCERSALHICVMNGDQERAKAILAQQPAAAKLTDWTKLSPLHYAVQNEDEGMVALLLAYRSTVTQEDIIVATEKNSFNILANLSLVLASQK